jgi:hypothetical protein
VLDVCWVLFVRCFRLFLVHSLCQWRKRTLKPAEYGTAHIKRGKSIYHGSLRTGLRNSLLVVPMPTAASTSQILSNNECFGPYTRCVLFDANI